MSATSLLVREALREFNGTERYTPAMPTVWHAHRGRHRIVVGGEPDDCECTLTEHGAR